MSAAAELITTGFPADPVLDIALSHALLEDVAGGRRPAALRLFRPGPTAAFGRLDALLPGFDRACAAAREHGLTPVLRSVGGHVAIFDQRSVVVERVTREADATAGLQARFESESARVRAALAALGADARIGELAGEYCPGAHSVNVGGRVKIAGIAQRIVRGGAATSAIVVAEGGPELRAAVADVYGALALPVDIATAGALDEELPGIGTEDVRRALLEAHADVAREHGEVDAALLAAAGALLPRHGVPLRSRT